MVHRTIAKRKPREKSGHLCSHSRLITRNIELGSRAGGAVFVGQQHCFKSLVTGIIEEGKKRSLRKGDQT